MSKNKESFLNDPLLVGSNLEMLEDTKSWLSSNFEMKDIGEASYIVGVRIIRKRSKKL